MGWFYGFKLHLIVNEKGDILNFVITQGNVDDREPLNNTNFLEKIKGRFGIILQALVRFIPQNVNIISDLGRGGFPGSFARFMCWSEGGTYTLSITP